MITVTTDPATAQVTALVPPGDLPAAVRAGVAALRQSGIDVRERSGPSGQSEDQEEAEIRQDGVIDLADRRLDGHPSERSA